MSNFVDLLAVSGGLFIIIFLLGYRLRRSGIPYNTFVVTVHKLSGLGLGVYLGIKLYRRHQMMTLRTLEILIVALTILLFAVNVATGSLLSSEKAMPPVVTTLNKFMPYLAILATAAVIFLVLGT
jgi:hypothetical protein